MKPEGKDAGKLRAAIRSAFPQKKNKEAFASPSFRWLARQHRMSSAPEKHAIFCIQNRGTIHMLPIVCISALRR